MINFLLLFLVLLWAITTHYENVRRHNDGYHKDCGNDWCKRHGGPGN